MVVHIDYPPTKNCKHPEWTYGLLCVKCGECGRFERAYLRNKPHIQLIEQFTDCVTELPDYPRTIAHYFPDNKEGKRWWNCKGGKERKIGNLEDMLSQRLVEEKTDQFRWWIEGRKY